jgi:predicted MFS family arabinose efflux permease
MRRLLAMVLFANMGFLYPTYTLFLLSRDLNLTEILSLESVLALGIMLWEVPSSVLADRWGRKKLIVLARLLDLISMIPMFWVRGFLPFAVLYAISGLAIASQSGALEAYLYETLPDRSTMTHHLGILRGAVFAAMLVGSVVGGLVVAADPQNGYSLCIGLAILSLAVAVWLAGSLPADLPKAQQQHESLSSIFKAGMRTVFGSGRVLTLAVLSITMIGFSEKHYLWQPYLRKLELPIGWFGLVAVGITTFSLAGSLLAGWTTRRWKPERVVLLAGGLSVLLLGVLVAVHHPLWGVLTLLGLFLLPSLLEPIFISMINVHFSDESRATALSGVSILSSTTHVIMRPWIGYLADRNILTPFRFDMLVVGLSAAVVLFFGKKIADSPLCGSK